MQGAYTLHAWLPPSSLLYDTGSLCISFRALTNNLVHGVSVGFTTTLELVGTGYRASATDKELTLNVGYSNPRVLAIPPGITCKVNSA
jgi:ribosomal protein L6P/L9E